MCIQGSSPLTRGKRGGRLRRQLAPGLIPAHAGKTRAGGPPPRRSGAHPRSRGENSTTPGRRFALTGSSPLTRGKLGTVADRAGTRGLIPAHAGKTREHADYDARIRAHPRSRGENVSAMTRPAPPIGSSPLTRGKQLVNHVVRHRDRLIPAHAGKTATSRVSPCREEAHPRSRGENRRK